MMKKTFLEKPLKVILVSILLATTCLGVFASLYKPAGDAETDMYIERVTKQNYVSLNERLIESAFSQTISSYLALKGSQDTQEDPYDIFITKDVENESELREKLKSYYSSNDFNSLNDQYSLEYYIKDNATDAFLSDNSYSPLKSLVENPKSSSSYPWYLVFSFDSEGVLNIQNFSFFYGNYESSSMTNTASLLKLYDDQLINSRGYSIRSEYGITDKNIVKDAVFAFALNQKTIDTQLYYLDESNYSAPDYYTYELTPIFNFSLLALAILLCYLKFDSKKLPGYNKFHKIPYEVHAIVSLILYCFVTLRDCLLYNLSINAPDVFAMASYLLFISIILYYFSLLIAMLKESYQEQTWKKHFQIFKVESYIMKTNLTKKLNTRIFTLTLLNFFIVLAIVIVSLVLASILPPFIFTFIYSIMIYYIATHFLSKTQTDYKKLLDITKNISTGKLEGEIEVDLGIFKDFKNDIEEIRSNFKHAVEEEVHSQKMKTELITNVSHDLKTPLTSIITYIDLLKKEDISEKDKKKYMHTLDRNALRLKSLIDDLFEVSKANSGNIKLDKIDIDICALMMQVEVELGDKLKKAKLDLRNNFSPDKVICYMDPQKTYRIFENLLSNVAKYAMPSTRVYIDVTSDNDIVSISIRNISASELNFKESDITERFMRGDASRNTEGSGLGLAIAKTFSQLHDGSLTIHIDGDLFKVILQFPTLQKQSAVHIPQE